MGNLSYLEQLLLNNNQLSGALPQSLTKLTKLERFLFQGTGLCTPLDPAFQAWLKGIANTRGSISSSARSSKWLAQSGLLIGLSNKFLALIQGFSMWEKFFVLAVVVSCWTVYSVYSHA